MQIQLVAKPDSHPTAPPRSQPHATSATTGSPVTVGGGAPPRFEFEFQVEKVDVKTGIMVEERQVECDEITQKSLGLLLTLPAWYQTWINTATETMLEKSKKLRTALAEKEAKAVTLKKLAREDGDYYHQLQVSVTGAPNQYPDERYCLKNGRYSIPIIILSP